MYKVLRKKVLSEGHLANKLVCEQQCTDNTITHDLWKRCNCHLEGMTN